MKYVLFESNGLDPDLPLMFPDFMEHSAIVAAIVSDRPGCRPFSAGFCDHQGNVWGESRSLKLKSDESDAWFIKKMMGLT